MLGLLGGTAVDDAPDRPPVMRAGFQVLEADFHAHTRFSDGLLSPFDLVLQARRRGLDALAITEHNNTFPATMGRWFSEQIGGPTILIGEEVTTRDYHIHGVGLTERLDASQPLDSVIDEIHRQGGVAIAAHPIRRFWGSLVPARGRFDATELMHPIVFGRGQGRWSWDEMVAYYQDARASGQMITAIGSSDYHFFSPLGVCRTLVFIEPGARDSRAEAAAIVEALKKGRTVVHDLEGGAYGDPALIEALTREPYEMRPQEYQYRGNGLIDRITRIAGLMGLFGLILFGRGAAPSLGAGTGRDGEE